MLDEITTLPQALPEIETAARSIGFTMSSDHQTGAVLRTLAASKPSGRLLELGTGLGAATAWLLQGMDPDAALVSVDNSEETSAIASRLLGGDPRVTFIVQDGGEFIFAQQASSFDLIFADCWPGKFSHLDETLRLLRPGGLYLVDDLRPLPSWSADHPAKVTALVEAMAGREDFHMVSVNWSTGVLIAARRR